MEEQFHHFFFQAEDGIRDFHVTGVQTCALPISGGGIGRRAWFRSMCRKVWRFESSPGHHRFTENPAKSADLAGFFVFAQTAGGRQNLAHDTTGYPIVYSTLSLHRACSWHRIASPHACSSSLCWHSQPWAPTAHGPASRAETAALKQPR